MASRKRYSFWINDIQAEGLKTIKAAEDISESEQIRLALNAWLRKKGALATKSGARRQRPDPMMPADAFLRKTDGAVRHLFAGIGEYVERYQTLPSPLHAPTLEYRNSAMQALERWMDIDVFSLSVLCGAVLQIADKGLDVCSTNTKLPKSCAAFAGRGEAKYCVGRDVHGLPLGAIIHAGRNQHEHWNEEEADHPSGGFHRFVEGVFGHLVQVYYSDTLMDLTYGLGNPFAGLRRSRADSLLLTTIRWTTFDQYERDMRSMLDVS